MVHPVLLTGFVGLLFGLGVARGADHLERVHVPRGISAPVLVLATYCALAGILAVAAPTLNKQFGELRAKLPQAMDRVDAVGRGQSRQRLRGEIFAGSSEGGGEGEGSTQSAEPAARAEPALPPATAARQWAALLAAQAKALVAGRRWEDGGRRVTVRRVTLPRAPGPRAAPGGAAPEQDGSPGGGLSAGQASAGSGGAPGSKLGRGLSWRRRLRPPRRSPAARRGSGGRLSRRLRVCGWRTSSAPPRSTSFPSWSSTVEVLAGLLLITFVAIFFGLDPLTYRSGLLHLVPHSGRERADEVLTAIGLTLRRWLATQLFAMLIIGSLVSISLALLGVEAALSLGIIAGVLEFIPTVGSIMAAVPAIAMGFLVSPQKALTVAIVFTLVQLLEGHLLIPMLMKRGMNLPPLITILGQAVMAVVFGFLGLLVAVPMLAVVMTTVKMLYVNDVVGDGVSTGAGVTLSRSGQPGGCLTSSGVCGPSRRQLRRRRLRRAWRRWRPGPPVAKGHRRRVSTNGNSGS